jgi:hypothetical protein
MENVENRLKILLHNAISLLADKTLGADDSPIDWIWELCDELGTTSTELEQFGIDFGDMYEEDDSASEPDFGAKNVKLSITKSIREIGLEDLICTSFEEAENNDRKKNLVIIDDSDIYLTYKYNGTFGEFLCWVEDELTEYVGAYTSMVEWVKDIYYREDDEIDRCIASNELVTGFKPY